MCRLHETHKFPSLRCCCMQCYFSHAKFHSLGHFRIHWRHSSAPENNSYIPPHGGINPPSKSPPAIGCGAVALIGVDGAFWNGAKLAVSFGCLDWSSSHTEVNFNCASNSHEAKANQSTINAWEGERPESPAFGQWSSAHPSYPSDFSNLSAMATSIVSTWKFPQLLFLLQWGRHLFT